jgi:hypothetical protein
MEAAGREKAVESWKFEGLGIWLTSIGMFP